MVLRGSADIDQIGVNTLLGRLKQSVATAKVSANVILLSSILTITGSGRIP